MWRVGVVVRRYINILIIIFPTPLVVGLFSAAASLLLCSFLNVFSVFKNKNKKNKNKKRNRNGDF